MARDITKLTKPMEAPAQWLEAVDPRLGAMGDLIEAGKVEEAADAAEEVLAEGYLDIRPVSVLLYASFASQGLEATPTIFAAADLAVKDNFTAIGPKGDGKKKKTLFDKRLGWLFDRISDQLDYHEKAKTGTIEVWTRDMAPEQLELAAATATSLASTLTSKEYDAAARAAGRLASWLRSRTEFTSIDLPVPNVPIPQPEPAQQQQRTGPVVNEDDNLRVMLAVSHKFHDLCNKLRAFETLVSRGRHDKAAVVAVDLQQLIENFDPRTYFPELFSEFAALMSEHVSTVTAHMEMKDTPAWNALDQFYRVDLKNFVER